MSIPEDHNSISHEPKEAANVHTLSTAPTMGFSHHWSTSLDSNPLASLSRSKSALDVSAAPRLRSTSQASYMIPSPRAETFPRVREEKPGSMKSLFSKSSRLLHRRRTSSKLRSVDWRNNISPPLSPGHLGTTLEEFIDQDVLPSRPAISDPYNFRHITHGGPAQAKVLQSAKPKQLATEFSMISASQAPKTELKDIKTDDLIPRRVGKTFSPIVCSSPGLPQYNRHEHTLRSVKSVDGFTRMASNSFSFPCPPLSTPPRTSSRPSQRFSNGVVINIVDRKMSNNSTPSSPSRMSSNDLLAPTAEIAQAVTTPDGSAKVFFTHQRTPSGIGLANVPEEVEAAAMQTSTARRPKELRHAKSFPARIVAGEDSASSQDVILRLGEEDIPAHGTYKQSVEAGQTNWEDDVDYCYKHAMESAGLEWEDKKESWATSIAAQYNNTKTDTSPYNQTFSGSSRGSAASSSISVPGLATPSDSVPSRDSFTTSHSLLFPISEPYSHTTCYEQSAQIVTYPDGIQTRTSTYPLTIVTDYSRRNSGSVASDWSPQESFSTANTSISAASATKKHRRGSSAGSFPDILPYGMGQQTMRSEITAASFHRSKSSEDVLSKMLSTGAPSVPAATRSRATSEAASKLLDLDLIGAPKPVVSSRSRAGSVASAKLRQATPSSTRVSYNLFPAANVTVPPR